jgi:hypothetical protein
MSNNAHTPAETIEIVSRAGVSKGIMQLNKVFFSLGLRWLFALLCSCNSTLNQCITMVSRKYPGLDQNLVLFSLPVWVVHSRANQCGPMH